MIYGLKFRSNKPGSPHLNGKVERSQKTDKREFYPTINVPVGLEDLDLLLAEWRHYYNWERCQRQFKFDPLIDVIAEVKLTHPRY